MKLRPYQSKTTRDIRAAWAGGAQNVCSVLPTGAGKTIIFSHELMAEPGVSFAIAHRQELISQISMALARYGVPHRVQANESMIKWIVTLHMRALGRHFYDPHAPCIVVGVRTLLNRADVLKREISAARLWVIDECAHIVRGNEWGKAVALFPPDCRGLGVTATPIRSDGKGLGRHADGVMDALVVGPSGRDMIIAGYLSDYRLFAPLTNLHLDRVPIGSTGDFSKPKLTVEVRKSTITGDVVEQYLKIAPGKIGVTFVTDVQTAADVAASFNAAGVPAEVVHAKTPDRVRQSAVDALGRGDRKQLVNVDIFGEGFDLPAIEVVSMARPTASYGLYCLDPITEVLTPDGWKGSSDLNDITYSIAYDVSDGSIKTVPVTGRIKRRMYKSETMYGISGPHLDIKVSDNHNMISKTCKNWIMQTAAVMANRRSLFKVPVSGMGAYPGSGLSKHEIHLLGWYLSDGTINKRTNALQIGQAINKSKHLSHIKSTLIGCGLKFGECVHKRKNVPKTHHDLIVFSASKGVPRGRDKHLTGWAHLEKWLHKDVPACYDSLTRVEFRELLYTLNLGDGVNNHSSLDYIKRTLTITCGTNKTMADRIQAMAVTRGFRCNIAAPHYEGRSQWFILHIRDSLTSSIAGKGVKDGKISGKKSYIRSRFGIRPKRPDFVWCVSNPLGTLITRRNGKVAIVGNCQQFGRAMRTSSGKNHAIIIDHVGNIDRHSARGLPDKPQIWTLDARDRRTAGVRNPDEMPIKTCTNCTAVYEGFHRVCPFCGHVNTPDGRANIEQVEGDLYELDPSVLAVMRGEIERIDAPTSRVGDKLRFAGAPEIAVMGAMKNHKLRQEAQSDLRHSIALWAGAQRAAKVPDYVSYRTFYKKFGVDVLGAQALGRKAALELNGRIK